MTQLLHFCRYWRMTPRDVDALAADEYERMIEYAVAQQQEERRAQRRAARQRR